MILPIENQITNFEISKKLYELGVRQDGLYYHLQIKHSDGDIENDIATRRILESAKDDKEVILIYYYAAYTVAELLYFLSKIQNEFAIGYNDCYGQYYIDVGSRGTGAMIEGCGDFKFSQQEFPVNALAEYLIYRIENGKAKTEDL